MCEPHDSTGEPGAGNRHAGFGERGEETCLRASDCGPAAKAPDEPPSPTGYAPPLDSTRMLSVPCPGLRRLGTFRRAERQVGADRDRDFPLGRMMSERRWRVTGRGRGLFAIEVDAGGGFRAATAAEGGTPRYGSGSC